MRIHCITHVAFEDAAYIETWAKDNDNSLFYTHLYKEELSSDMNSYDMLAIMGGPMNIYEYEQYPWLKTEKRYIADAIEKGKLVIGICLGGQLIADVLGAKVRKNSQKEIGWHKVSLANQNRDSLFSALPKVFTAFHWHGDTFDIPTGAVHLASSEACVNQAFQFGSKVLGLQFHFEYTQESISKMLHHCSQELTEGKYIQNAEVIRSNVDEISNTNKLMAKLLNRFTSPGLYENRNC